MSMSSVLRKKLLQFQENEITEYHIYSRLADTIEGEENRKVLKEIAEDERRHYREWKEVTGEDVEPRRLDIWRYTLIGRLLGFTFALKLLEQGEEGAQEHYDALIEEIPKAEAILRDENAHEEALLDMLDEELLRYTGSIVLGLSDALVELTGALAGLTLALQDTTLIALSASITGIAASLSMGASEYLSTKSEGTAKSPTKAALYTGFTYVVTVTLLVLPYLLLANYFVCLLIALTVGVVIIAAFNFYVAVAQDEPFRRRFVEMAGLSLGVSAVSFLIGLVVRNLFGVEV